MKFGLRAINTLLVFLIGLGLGYVITRRKTANVEQPVFSVPAESGKQAALAPEKGNASDEPLLFDYEDKKTEKKAIPSGEKENVFDTDLTGEVKKIIAEKEGMAKKKNLEVYPLTVSEEDAADNLEGVRDRFFESPSSFKGKTVSMELQMIVAKKTRFGWRLNLIHRSSGKEINYIYIDAERGLMGNKPDVKIGYYYLVRFRCVEGDLSSGNELVSIRPTGRKAEWATGISALED